MDAAQDDEDLRPARTERLRVGSRRLEGLLTGAGPHVEAVLDVGTTPAGDLILLVEEPAARLPDLLAVAGFPSPGEAVTLLVPLVGALDRLHAAGVALDALDAGLVGLDASGSPWWSVPPSAVLAARVAPGVFGAAAAADRTAFARFARGLLRRAGLEVGSLPDDADGVALALFALAEPEAVRLHPVETPPHEPPAAPQRLVPPTLHVEDRAGAPGRAAGRADRVARAARRVRREANAVRPRVWLLAGGAGAALLAALVLLPSGGSQAERRSTPSPSPPRSVGIAAPSARPSPVAASSGADAVRRLLAARTACLERGSASCLAVVEAPGSPALALDRRAVDSGTDPVRVASGPVRVLSDGGGAVVADVHGVTVVAVRTERTWRLRDVVAEPPG